MSKRLTCLLALACAASAAPAVNLQVRGPYGAPGWKFDIESISFEGDGCPPGSTFSAQGVEGSAVSTAFSVLYAEASPASPIPGKTSCKVSLALEVPDGFQVGLKTVGYNTFYDLEADVTASRSSSYSFEGQTTEATSQSVHTGPLSNSQFTTSDVYDSTTAIKSACGQNTVLNLNIDVEVDNSAASSSLGFGVVDTIDTLLEWDVC